MTRSAGKNEDPKLQIYDLQRQINDYEYQVNSDEVALKRKRDEELRVQKKEQEQIFQEYFAKVEESRVEQYNLEDQKNSLSRQLETLLMSVYNDQNEKESAMDEKDGSLQALQAQINSIQDFKKRVSTLTNQQ